MRDVEHQIAVAVMNWWALSCRRFRVAENLLFAVPNGGHRHIAVARRMKAEGVRPGVSDYFLAVPRGPLHGLFLELKAGGKGVKKGRPSTEQMLFGNAVQVQGYGYTVAYGTDEAINALELYLNLPVVNDSPGGTL